MLGLNSTKHLGNSQMNEKQDRFHRDARITCVPDTENTVTENSASWLKNVYATWIFCH